MNPLIISFYTNDWCYPEHAARLKKECRTHGLSYYIEEVTSTRDYIKNTAIKPHFIRDVMTRLDRPVIWIDVDALMLKRVDIDLSGCDIAACKHTDSRLNRAWAVATLGFNNTPGAKRFLDVWCENSKTGTDENSFEITWQHMCNDISVKELPATYHFVKWSNRLVVPDDTIICHQLSKFEDKMRRKTNGRVDEGME